MGAEPAFEEVAAYGDAGQDAVTGFWRVCEGLVPPAERRRIADLQSG